MAKQVLMILGMICVGAVLLATQGCGKKTPAQGVKATGVDEAAQMELEQAFFTALESAYMQGSELLAQAQTNEAVALFAEIEKDPRWQVWAERIAGEKIRFLLHLGQAEAARAQVLQLCATGPATVAAQGLEMLLGYLQENAGFDAAWELAESAAAVPGVPAEVVQLATEWRFGTALRAADMPRAAAALGGVLQTFPADAANRILSNAFDYLFGSGRLDDVDSLLALLKASQGGGAERAQLLVAVTVRLAAQRHDWSQTESLFAAAAADLPDAALSRLLAALLPVARRENRYATLDVLAEAVIFKHADKSAAATQAARIWGDAAMATNRAVFPQRLEKMLAQKISINTVAGLFTRYFYNLIDDNGLVGAMLPVADRLLEKCDTDTAKLIKTMRLDGAFVREDYGQAIVYLEAGIPERDTTWHKMALTKVKAHQALKKGDLREAAQFFRDFMVCIDDVKNDDAVDPATGVQHTKDMLRGRNAKRIAEILAAIPDTAAAAAAHAEAAEYYRKALADAADDETRDIIAAEAGDLLK